MSHFCVGWEGQWLPGGVQSPAIPAAKRVRIIPEGVILRIIPEGPLVASKCDNQIRASHCWCLDLQRKQRGVSLYVLHFLESWTNIYLRPLVGRVLGWLKNFSFVHQPCAFLHLNTAWSLGLWHVLPPQGVHLWHYKIGIDVLLLEWLDYPETAESLFQFFCISLYF